MDHAPPTIFSNRRRIAARERLHKLQRGEDAARFVIDDMVEDIAERLAFLRHEPKTALVIGDWTGDLARQLAANSCTVTSVSPEEGFNEEQPYSSGGYDLIASLGTLDTANDLPGALIHIRSALAPGGLAIASFPGAGSLLQLRQIMLAADGERPAGRMHPLVDVRAAAQLLQRAGWADPVVDSHPITAAYRSFDRLVGDIRAQGLGNVLARPAPPGGRAWLERARSAFDELSDGDGRLVESFEVLTLSGRKPARRD